MNEHYSDVIQGRWKDRIIYDDGSVEETQWRHNQIQANAPAIIASSLARFSETTLGSGYSTINYLAIGEGSVTWDTTPPAQPVSDDMLESEQFRKEIIPASFAFIDPSDMETISSVPTRVLQIQVTIERPEANFTHREFGLFGANATSSVDSGMMFNWIVHGAISKDNSMKIVRTIRLIFAEQ